MGSEGSGVPEVTKALKWPTNTVRSGSVSTPSALLGFLSKHVEEMLMSTVVSTLVFMVLLVSDFMLSLQVAFMARLMAWS